MTPVPPPEWGKLIEMFAISGIPWITQLKELEIHLKESDYDWRGVDNFFGTLFAFAAFAYCTYAQPAELLWLPSWVWCISTGFVLTLLYVGIFTRFRNPATRGKLGKGAPFFNFVVYVVLLVSLTTGFALLRLRGSYVLVRGTIAERVTRLAIPNAFVAFRTHDGQYSEEALTDSKGRFAVYIDRRGSADIGSIAWSAEGFEADKQDFNTGDPVWPIYALVLKRVPR